MVRSAPDVADRDIGYVPPVRLGADSGGTFTDVVGTDGRILKIPSTPLDPGRAVRSAVTLLAGDRTVDQLAHGTTVATNALLERSGAVVALVTTAGLADVIEIGRQARPSLYDPWADRPEPLVARRHRLEATGRLGADGVVVEPWLPGSLPAVPEGVESIAVVLVHADLDPTHEQQVAAELARRRVRGERVARGRARVPGVRANRHHGGQRLPPARVSAVPRGTGGCGRVGVGDDLCGRPRRRCCRSSDTCSAAVVGPCRRRASCGRGGDGVRVPGRDQLRHGRHQHRRLPDPRRRAGARSVARRRRTADPPAVARRAHRGSRRRQHRLDRCGGCAARRARVGGRAAGSGLLPTWRHAADGHRRRPGAGAHPCRHRLLRSGDAGCRRSCYEPWTTAGVDAAGVVAVVNAQMEQALRTVSVERGVDPSTLALVAFGGAGPLHACDLADAAGIPVVIVPGAAGVLSAVGLLTSPRRREVVRSWPRPDDTDGLAVALEELGRQQRSSCSMRHPARTSRPRPHWTAATPGRATSCASVASRTSPGSTAPATATTCPVRRSRSSRCERSPRRQLLRRSATCSHAGTTAPSSRCADRRWSAARTARSGCRRGGPASPARWARSCCDGPGPARERARSRRAERPDRPAVGRRRGDGCGAPARGVQPQHQGTRRLLRSGVRRVGGDARAGRAHPGAPGLDAGIGRCGDRRTGRAGAGRAGHRQRPVRRWHPPERHHGGRTLLARRHADRLGGQPCAPRRCRRWRARFVARRRDRDLRRGPPSPTHRC